MPDYLSQVSFGYEKVSIKSSHLALAAGNLKLKHGIERVQSALKPTDMKDTDVDSAPDHPVCVMTGSG